ncbi:MAG: nucleotide-binding protein [Acidobacteriota bacterium]
MTRVEAAKRIDDRISKGREIRETEIRTGDVLQRARNQYYTWTEYNEEMLRQMFSTDRIVSDYIASVGFFVAGGERYLEQEVADFHDDVDSKLRRLESIRGRLELIPEAPGIGPVGSSMPSAAESEKVFIVHGRDEAARESVARFVDKLGLEPIVLHEQASQGRTVVEKLEAAGNVGFAVVLLTPDDVGGLSGAELQPRARQNVVLELGYFVGRLQRNRVCALFKGELELPSDYMGVVYIPLDAGGGWRLQLAKELKAAGLPVDMNRAID